MRTKVKTSFLNAGSTCQSGVPTLSEGASRAVRYCATPRPMARNRTTGSAHSKAPLLTAIFYPAVGLERRSLWARPRLRPAGSSAAAGGDLRGNAAPPPAPGAGAVWRPDHQLDKAAAPVGNGPRRDRVDRAAAKSCRLGWLCPARPGVRWPAPGSG